MWQAWLSVILGIWLILAPFLLNFTGAARWNSLVVGIIVAIVSFWANSQAQSKGVARQS